MKIKKGDTVKILYGKDAGKSGKVLKAVIKDSMVVVDGLNLVTKHLKGNGKDIKSEIVKIVKPIHISKVMLICPVCGKATRVKTTRDEKGKSVRICVKCGKVIANIEVEKPKVEVKKTSEKTAKKDDKSVKKTTVKKVKKEVKTEKLEK